jgi:hypothetical protein
MLNKINKQTKKFLTIILPYDINEQYINNKNQLLPHLFFLTNNNTTLLRI